MRRRSVKVSYLLSAIAILFAVMVFCTSFLGPVEGTLLDLAGRLLLGTRAVFPHNNTLSLPPSSASGARVIAKRSDEFRDIFLIDKAFDVNQKIFSGDVLIGFVISSGNNTSKVRSITSPGFKVDGVSERAGIPLSLEGKGASILESKVPRGSDIREGDIITHNEGNAHIVGSIQKIIDVASDPFLRVIVLHPVNFSTLATVEAL
jgi:hypothetical protein